MSKVHHLKKFADGRETPEEMHRRIAFHGGVCFGCKSRKVAIRIKTFMPADELMKRQPHVAATLIAMNPNGPYLPTMPTKSGPMVLVASVFACDNCKAAAEKAAARGPSWVLVDIDRGPPKHGPMSQVPMA